MNAWLRCCERHGDNMSWAQNTPIETRDIEYLFQLYFRWRRLDTVPVITERGRIRLNIVWKHCSSDYMPSFNHHKVLSDRKKYRFDYEQELLSY